VNKKQTEKHKKQTNHPEATKWGVRVYYDGATEHFLREKAHRRGFINVQAMLSFDARKEREAHEAAQQA